MFRKLTETVFASPQIGLAEVAAAKAQGIVLIVNNRPEGESDDQMAGEWTKSVRCISRPAASRQFSTATEFSTAEARTFSLFLLWVDQKINWKLMVWI